jgi:tetratricopeptide (TPR) repeat protein
VNDARLRGGQCLDAETVAEYVDRCLDPAALRRAEAHLADCELCREAVMEVSAITAEAGQGRVDRWRRPWLPLGTVAAAALLISIVWLGVLPGRQGPEEAIASEVSTFAAAIRGARALQPRLSGPFQWAPLSAGPRGASGFEPSLEARESALRIERLARANRTAETLAALGMTRLAVGEIEGGIEALEDSIGLDPSRPSTQIDLAAGYLARWGQTGNTADASRALDAADTALRLEPASDAAVFNRALSLEALGLIDAAAAAWQAFLSLSTDDNWRREAVGHLDRLPDRRPVTRQSTPSLLDAPPDELDRMASSDPAALERAIAERLPRILDTAAAVPAEVAAVRAWSAALVRADRDRFWPHLVSAALVDERISSRQRACLRVGLQALASSRRHFDVSDYRSAEHDAASAVAFFDCAGVGTVEGRMQLAWTLFFREQRDVAVQMVARLRGQAAQSRYWRTLARIDYLTGLRAIASAELGTGLRAYGSALEAAERSGDAELIALVSTMRAEGYRNLGEPEIAWDGHGVALRLLPELSPRRRHVVLAGAALTATQSGHPYVADVMTTELVRTAAEGSDVARLAGAHLQRARTLLDLSRDDEAARALALTERLIPEISETALRQQYQTEFKWLSALTKRSSNPGLAVRHFDEVLESLSGTKRRYRLAEVLLERGRARAATGDQPGAVADWARGIEYFEREGDDIGDRYLRISRANRLWDLFAEMIAAHLSEPAAALSFAERSRARSLWEDAAGSSAERPGSLSWEWVPSDVDLVYYVVLRERLVIWHIARGGARAFIRDLPSKRLEAMVGEFLRFGDGSPGEVEAPLSALLLPEGVPSAPGRRIIFLPDGVLHRVPFSLLISSSGRRLFEDSVPAIAPSLAFLRRHVVPPPAIDRNVLLVGVSEPRPREGLAALPGVDDEIGRLARVHAGLQVHVLTGREATADRVLTRMADADVVHFAGHAVMNELHPSRSRLLTSAADGRGELMAEDVARTRLRPGSVVVLSACDTGNGRIYRGEGGMGLARAFLASGASSVVAALWKVPDGETTTLLQGFHAGLKGGMDAGAALAEAKRVALRQGISARSLGVFEVMTSSLKERNHGW